jgi:AcrR family transcriptional regulator
MSNSNKVKPRGTYHHGNAKKALLAAAHALLESEGAAGLSLRQVAERARLSRQAPYNHFADKEALLAELVRDAFEQLCAAVTAASGRGTDPLAQAAAAYIQFAQESPALFRLMFSRELVDLSKFAAAKAAAEQAFGSLSAIVARFAPADRVADLSLAAWSMVHGYATLCIEAKIEPDDLLVERAHLFAQLIRSENPSATNHRRTGGLEIAEAP